MEEATPKKRRDREARARWHAELARCIAIVRAARGSAPGLALSDAEAARLARLALSGWNYGYSNDQPYLRRVELLARRLEREGRGRLGASVARPSEPYWNLALDLANYLDSALRS